MGYIRISLHGDKVNAGELIGWFESRGFAVQQREDEAVIGKDLFCIQWWRAGGKDILRLETRRMHPGNIKDVCCALLELYPEAEFHYDGGRYDAENKEILVSAVLKYACEQKRANIKAKLLLGMVGVLTLMYVACWAIFQMR